MSPTATAVELKSCPLYIDGKPVISRGQKDIQYNPATGEAVAEIPRTTAEEISAAVESARKAFEHWSKTPVLQRCRVLFKYRQVLEANAQELISLITEENGKTLEESRGSFQRGIECIEFACGAPSLMMGDTVEQVGTGVDGWSVRTPIGVCVGTTPFNFPFMVPLWMFPMAIACGNTFVLKPSDKVPRTAVRLVELAYEAGLPAGVLNLVHGAKETVDRLLTDPRVKAVSFVGSSAVARYIYQTAANNGKRVQALGGAKNHSVVLPDAEMKSTVAAVMGSSFGCAGERCLATSVVVAVGEAGDPLVKELVKAADNLSVGAGCEAKTGMGPVITEEAKKRILGYIDLAEKEGAVLARDGRSDAVTRGNGYFVGPTILDKVDPNSRVAKEEIFGPVLSVIRVKDIKEALEVIRNSEYGNAASVFTRSGGAAREFTQNVSAGMVGINVGVPAPVAFFPFAGWKNSFFGDLHALGKDAVHFYTEQRVVTCRWPD
ncbi:MAG TPA: CoA-acylating methylmalonate-semialdehyde dehydrogenase [Candidatus Angelobacter sp.]|nr:CoA-acylating methylmalonate-semialdehyde dehydrogenase [Candidatus Angelobacter sp.]